jgi:hypothetical protein
VFAKQKIYKLSSNNYSLPPPTPPPPLPLPIHDCAYGALITFDCDYGAFITLGSECDLLPEAVNNI